MSLLVKMTSNEKPERHGKPWSVEEEDFVLRRIQERVPKALIAEETKRSCGAIHSHLLVIAHRELGNGMKIDDASRLTNIPTYIIEDYLERKKLQESVKLNRIQRQKETAQHFKEEEGSEQPTFPSREKRERLLDVAIEIRDLLKILVENSKSANPLSSFRNRV